MTARITKLLLLFSGLLLSLSLAAQYPSNPIKSRLGWQTTGDGLVYRGSGAPAYSPGTLFNAWMYLDTTNYTLYMYKNFQWTKLPLVNNGLTLDAPYVQLGGTLVENTQVERSTYTLDFGKISGTNFGYASFYGTDPHYFGVLTKKDGTESGLTIGNKTWGFEVDDASHVSSISGTRFGFDATYLGTLGVSQFKMDSARFFMRGLISYASHTAADASTSAYQMYMLDNSRRIYVNQGTATSDILGTGTAARSARWSATNTLAAGNFTDNGTKIEALLPFQFASYTTAGLPTGVTGYHIYNTTTNGPGWYQGSRWAYGLESTFNRGTSTRMPFFNSNGQITDDPAIVFDGTNNVLTISNDGTTEGVITIDGQTVATGNPGRIAYTSGAAYTQGLEITSNKWIRLISSTVDNYVSSAINVFSGNYVGLGGAAVGGRSIVLTGASATTRFQNYAIFNAIDGNFASTIYSTPLFIRGGNASTAHSSGVAHGGDVVIFGGTPISTGNNGDVILAYNGTTALGKVGIAGTPSYELHVNGTDAIGLPRGTVAQRPTIVSSTTPFRYNTDSTALEYGESVGTWRLLATRAYARSLVSALPTTNIYTADGTLSGNRVVNGGTHNLDFGSGTVGNLPQFNVYADRNYSFGYDAPGRQYELIMAPNQLSLLVDNVADDHARIEMKGDTMKLTTGDGSFGDDEGFGLIDKQFYISNGNFTSHTFQADIPNKTIIFNQYGAGNKEAADLSKTASGYLAGFATDGTVLDLERKRDTTIFVTADTDYDFSAAVTTAQIARRYNRIIIHMTLTSGVGADKTTTLHTPDANLMQCEILIRGTDNTGTYDNEIAFGTNNAISSDGTNASGYTLTQGQGLHVRVVYNGSAYKYIYY